MIGMQLKKATTIQVENKYIFCLAVSWDTMDRVIPLSDHWAYVKLY